MTGRRFTQVEVFAAGPLTGNPLAVVLDADGLDEAAMASFARWTGLSETTFLLPPRAVGADYRVRIFTPTEELPFAGHPTLGSAYAWLDAGGVPTGPDIVQECGAGLVRVRRSGARLAFAAPPLTRSGPLDPATLERVCQCLAVRAEEVVDHAWGVNGPRWAMVRLASAEQVLALRPQAAVLAGATAADRLDVGVCGMAAPGSDHAYEVRAFVAPPAPAEDPVTGSLQAALAQWLRGQGAVPASYRARQGRALGFDGWVRIDDDGTDIWVGGQVAVRVRGTVNLG